MSKILVTGANGFLGYYLIKQLLESVYTVIATGKGECRLPFDQDNFLYQSMDFTNAGDIRRVFNQHSPSIVVHCGAESKPDVCELNKEAAFLSNVTGTIQLLDAAEKNKAFFILLSTDFVFSGDKGMYKEDDQRSPVNYYGQTKLLAEDEVMKYPYHWSIVRTVLVYGRPISGRQNILSMAATALQKGEKLRIFHDQVRTPTYVEDLASAIISIVERNCTGIFHISGKDVLTPYEMVVATANYLCLDATLIEKVTEKDFQQPARRPLKTGFDLSKAEKTLNYRPVSFEEGLEKTFQ
jgi:dTDP-4-dehydrorhamnose reductase